MIDLTKTFIDAFDMQSLSTDTLKVRYSGLGKHVRLIFSPNVSFEEVMHHIYTKLSITIEGSKKYSLDYVFNTCVQWITIHNVDDLDEFLGYFLIMYKK